MQIVLKFADAYVKGDKLICKICEICKNMIKSGNT